MMPTIDAPAQFVFDEKAMQYFCEGHWIITHLPALMSKINNTPLPR